MRLKMGNKNMHRAKRAKNDEFYTRLEDIEKELQHYEDCFKGKVIYCNCDDPETSNFAKYFDDNFESLNLKKLIITGYNENGKGKVYIRKNDSDKCKFRIGDVIRKEGIIYVIVSYISISGTGYGSDYVPAQKRYTIVQLYNQKAKSYLYEKDFDQIKKIGRANLEWVLDDDKIDGDFDDDFL
jgi:hypothetical protein